MWSSSVPSPSRVARSLARYPAKSCTWYRLIFDMCAIRSGRLPWCDSGWCASGTPICGYGRALCSFEIMNVMTRVRSDWNASSCRSSISAT